MKKIAVFCGSSEGTTPDFMELAKELGTLMAAQGIDLVYGGAQIGLMGAVADAVLAGGGKAYGVLPHFLSSKEIAHSRLTDLIIVDTMHERKAIMAEMADAFIAIPGGFGTLEELFEMLTWSQLKLHQKPIGLLNHNDFYTPMLQQFDTMLKSGFIRNTHMELFCTENSPEAVLSEVVSRMR